MTDPHRHQLERRRAALVAEVDELRPHVEHAWREALQLERDEADPRLLAFAQQAAAHLEDRLHLVVRALVAVDEELEKRY